MKTNTYAEYLKQLPGEWERVTIESLGEIYAGGTPSRNNNIYWNGSIAWVTPSELTVLRDKWLRETKEYITEKGLVSSAAKLLPIRSLLVTTRATIGSIAICAIPVSTNQGFKSLIPNGMIYPIFFYYLLHMAVPEMLRLASGSTFLEISRHDFASIVVPRPELDEQRCIAKILDSVDNAIRLNENFIAKLKQLKVTLLHILLTRGIGKDGKVRDPQRYPEQFKDSPLGIMPKDWEVTSLKEGLVDIDAGKSPNCLTRPAGAGEWGVLKVSAIGQDGFKPDENKAVMNNSQINRSYEVKDGDFLISRSNTYELVGLACIVRNPPSKLMLCDKTLRLNINQSRAVSEFLLQVMRSQFVRSQIELKATGSSGTMKNITQVAIENLLIPLPSIEEQKVILEILNAHDASIDLERIKLRKLNQLKRALMNDLLSGRVRVKKIESEKARI